ncbi:MAG: alpha/beta hydrolase [Leptolyngbyaceae cyanobacterium HOT.MB2.61]|nr:alpha/beta hydrolase [Leptolyngbyaceae cyanobacterium HOT.MB2.61]
MNASTPSVSTINQFDLEQIEVPQPEPILGYFVTSTAPINVEEKEPDPPAEPVKKKIRKIAQFLVESNDPEIVIAIHGYGTERADAKARYEKILKYAAEICKSRSHVFLGYLWPSEKPTGDRSISDSDGLGQSKIGSAWNALPKLLSIIFVGGILVSFLTTVLLFFLQSSNQLLIPILIIAVILFSLILTLIFLRLATYFRDHYRATNFGVLDLVELIRQIDQAVYEIYLVTSLEFDDIQEELSAEGHFSKTEWERKDWQEKLAIWDRISDLKKVEIHQKQGDNIALKIKRINLNFIGHSMGCFIVTNTIRILSDVFDQLAIAKVPTSEIGQVFCLDRLILIAPDIPVEAIMSRRANFLQSSLRRCKEAYVFSNEADLAVRLASTAANYFSFPAKTRLRGYRLGNISVKRFTNQNDHRNQQLEENQYGIVNRSEDAAMESPYDYLEIRASASDHANLDDITKREDIRKEAGGIPVSDLFTYFDCTDYVDYEGDAVEYEKDPALIEATSKQRGIVSYALRKSALSFWDYSILGFSYFFGWFRFIFSWFRIQFVFDWLASRFSWLRFINVHGGFFNGIYSQQAIYKLAFLGFKNFLRTLDVEGKLGETPYDELSTETREYLLNNLSNQCQKRGIQVILSPARYEKDVLMKS